MLTFQNAVSEVSLSVDDEWELGETEMEASASLSATAGTGLPRVAGGAPPNVDRLRCAFSPGDIIGCGVFCRQRSSSTAPPAPSSNPSKDSVPDFPRVNSSSTTTSENLEDIVGVFFTVNGLLGGFLTPEVAPKIGVPLFGMAATGITDQVLVFNYGETPFVFETAGMQRAALLWRQFLNPPCPLGSRPLVSHPPFVPAMVAGKADAAEAEALAQVAAVGWGAEEEREEEREEGGKGVCARGVHENLHTWVSVESAFARGEERGQQGQAFGWKVTIGETGSPPGAPATGVTGEDIGAYASDQGAAQSGSALVVSSGVKAQGPEGASEVGQDEERGGGVRNGWETTDGLESVHRGEDASIVGLRSAGGLGSEGNGGPSQGECEVLRAELARAAEAMATAEKTMTSQNAHNALLAEENARLESRVALQQAQLDKRDMNLSDLCTTPARTALLSTMHRLRSSARCTRLSEGRGEGAEEDSLRCEDEVCLDLLDRSMSMEVSGARRASPAPQARGRLSTKVRSIQCLCRTILAH